MRHENGYPSLSPYSLSLPLKGADQQVICETCGKEAGLIGRKRIATGYICGSCAKKMPRFAVLEHLSQQDAKRLVHRADELDRIEFSDTASVGKLKVDERHGLIQIDGDRVYCLDISEIRVYPENPRAHNGRVSCDIRFTFTHEICGDADITVARGVACPVKRLEGNRLSWHIPGEIAIMNDMIIEMMKHECRLALQRQEMDDMRRKSQILATSAEGDAALRDAMALYMVDEGYTSDEIHAQKRRLMKAFHPDTGKVDPKYAQRISNAYDLLDAELRKRGGEKS